MAEPFQSLAPDHDERAEREQHGDHGDADGAAERGEAGHDLDEVEPHDDDREQRDRKRKQREPPRPQGEPRDRIFDDATSRHGDQTRANALECGPLGRRDEHLRSSPLRRV